MLKKKSMDISPELIALITLLLVIILLGPKCMAFLQNWIKSAPDDVERQLEAILPDIYALENGKSRSIPFAVNEKKETYKMVTYKACENGKYPEQDKETDDISEQCSRRAKLCLENVEGKQVPLCKELEKGNFKSNREYYPSGKTITIVKDADGNADFIT